MDRVRLASQQQKRGLEDVLGELLIGNDAPCQSQHARSVAVDQRGEGVPSRPTRKRWRSLPSLSAASGWRSSSERR
jgi:hypothetical protein